MNHSAEALHGGVMRLVQGVLFVGEQFYSLSDAPGLVNAALFADGQVHGQMQKRIFLGGICVQHAGQGSI